MKNLTSILLISSLFILLFSCDDDNVKANALDGEWHLIKVTGGFAGVNNDIERGEVVWNFDESTSKLNIDNQSASLFSGLATGTYDYSVTSEGQNIVCSENDLILVDENDFGCYFIVDETLEIDENGDNGADGFGYVLVR